MMKITLEDLYVQAKQCQSQAKLIELIQTLLPIDINEQIFSLLILKVTQSSLMNNENFVQLAQKYINNNLIKSFSVIRNFFFSLSQNKRQLESTNLDSLAGALFMLDFFISKQFLKELESGDSDILIIQVFQMPNLVRNIFKNHPKILKFEELYYLKLIESLINQEEILETSMQQKLIDKLILSGQIKLLVQKLQEMKNFTMLQNILSIDSLVYYNKLLLNLILQFIEASDTAISTILMQLNQTTLKQCFVNIINSSQLEAGKYSLLSQIIIKSCSEETKQDLILDLIIKWSDQDFSKYASKNTQYNTTNIIASLLDHSEIKKFTKLDTFISLINDGVQFRLNYFQNFDYIRQSGLVIWRHLVKFLDLPSTQDKQEMNQELDIPEFLVDSHIQEEQKVEPSVEVTEIIENLPQIEEEFINLDYTIPDLNSEGLPKSIYDSLIALQNGNPQRIKLALQHLPYLVRKELSDIQIYSEELTNLLLRIHHDDSWEHNFDELRKEIIVALLIITTKQTANALVERFFSDDCSIGDKHSILLTLIEAVDELSNNPSRYPVQQFNEYSAETNQTFFFQKVSTKYYAIEDQQCADSLQMQRKDRIDEKSRRWGQTRKLHDLKSLTRRDLLIMPQDQEASFQNRFHGLLEHIFFPIVINAQTKLRLVFVREPLLLTHFFQMCTKMLDCAKFSFDLYKMIEECADLTALMKQNKNMQVLRSKLQMWLKVSVLIQKQVIHEHPLLLQKIMSLLESFNCHEVREMHDNQTKTILAMIYENFKNILQIQLQ